MTLALTAAKKAKISFTIHEYKHDPTNRNFGMEAVEKLGLSAQEVFKTLLAKLDGSELVVAVIPVAATLDLKALAQAFGAKKAEMADVKEAEKATGYIAGGISPLGQRKRLPMVIDSSAQSLETMYVSGGKHGLDIGLSPHDLARLTQAEFAEVGRV